MELLTILHWTAGRDGTGMRRVQKESFMREYEIRILKPAKSSSMIIEAFHASDTAAIAVAQRLAGENPFEVWSGLECIHGPLVPAVQNHRPAA